MCFAFREEGGKGGRGVWLWRLEFVSAILSGALALLGTLFSSLELIGSLSQTESVEPLAEGDLQINDETTRLSFSFSFRLLSQR